MGRKEVKSSEQRISEMNKLVAELLSIGFPSNLEGIQEFIQRAQQFQENGPSDSGKIKLVGFNRIINYTFSVQPHIPSRVVLQFDKNI